MKTATKLTAIVTAALIGSTTILQPTNAQSQTFLNDGNQLAARTLAGTTEAWQLTENVSNDAGVSMMPSLKVGPDDDVHLVWMGESESGFDIYYSRRTDGVWSSPVKVNPSAQLSIFPALAVSTTGEIHVSWMGKQPNGADIFHCRRSGNEWSKPLNISDNHGISQRPKIVLDSLGIAHAIWYDNTSGSFNLWHAQTKSGTWSPAANTKLVDWYLTDDPGFTLSPGLTADSRGNIHVLWPDLDIATQHLFHSRWDGKAWSDKEKVSGFYHRRTSKVVVTADLANNMHAAWFDSDDVWYGKRSGDDWSKPVRIGRLASLPAIYADQVGIVHIAWTHNDQIHYSKKTYDIWSDSISLSESPGDCAAPTLETDSAGRVHIAWMDNRPGNPDILYRHSVGHE